jgi:hypothetical protein
MQTRPCLCAVTNLQHAFGASCLVLVRVAAVIARLLPPRKKSHARIPASSSGTPSTCTPKAKAPCQRARMRIHTASVCIFGATRVQVYGASDDALCRHSGPTERQRGGEVQQAPPCRAFRQGASGHSCERRSRHKGHFLKKNNPDP